MVQAPADVFNVLPPYKYLQELKKKKKILKIDRQHKITDRKLQEKKILSFKEKGEKKLNVFSLPSPGGARQRARVADVSGGRAPERKSRGRSPCHESA